MGRTPKPIDEIELSGNSRKLTLEQIADRRADENRPLPLSREQEVKKLDELIADALEMCDRGQTVHGKRNPAFVNLALLLKCRSLVETGRRPKKTAADILAEADRLAKGVN